MDVASTYKLCDKFGLDEFIIPCLLKGQEAAVTAYLKDNQLKDLQVRRFKPYLSLTIQRLWDPIKHAVVLTWRLVYLDAI